LSVLGLAHYRAGAWKEAIAALERAEKLPGRCEAGSFVLAMAYRRLDDKQNASTWYRRGNAWMERRHPLREEMRRLQAEAKTTLGIREDS
jgi:hypothetical protein